jgi:glycosyltransferase involved in cell wall biosynthesis
MVGTMSARPHILILVQNLPLPLDRRVWQEASSLRDAGFNVSAICPKSDTHSTSHQKLEDIDIYRYPLLIEADNSVGGYCIEFVYCWVATLLLACRVYFTRRFQVIHACNPPDTFFAIALLFRPLGVRFVFDHHDLCPDLYIAKGHTRGGVIYRLLLFLEWMTFRTADLVLAANDSYRHIAKTRGGVPDERIEVVRSGPCRAWAQSGAPAPNLKRGRKYLVLFHGQIGKQDGVDYLVRSIQLYLEQYGRDTLFVIVGEGPSQRNMRRLAYQLGITECAEFTGRIPDDQLRKYLSTADVCVDPDPCSEFNNLSTMNKIVEYMSFGKPIVAFDLLEHRRSALEAALYVEPDNISKFAAGIRELLENEQTRQQMSKCASERFNDALAWEMSEVHLLRAYETVTRRLGYYAYKYEQA